MLKHSRAPWRIAARDRDMVRIADADGWTVANANVEDGPTVVHAPQLRTLVEDLLEDYVRMIRSEMQTHSNMTPEDDTDIYPSVHRARMLLNTIEQMEGD